MRTAVQLMKSRVVQSDKHRVGVTFFGTKKTSDVEVGSSFARLHDPYLQNAALKTLKARHAQV